MMWIYGVVTDGKHKYPKQLNCKPLRGFNLAVNSFLKKNNTRQSDLLFGIYKK